jgi:type II secretory pathway pseudopilin PulG
MREATIIDVDLGQGIDDILNEDLRKLTAENKLQIEKAMADKLSTAKKKTAKLQAKTQQEQLIQTALENAFQLLNTARSKDEAIPIDKLLEVSAPAITNPSSLISRLKRYLSDHGKEYVVKRKVRQGKPVYELLEYNANQQDS